MGNEKSGVGEESVLQGKYFSLFATRGRAAYLAANLARLSEPALTFYTNSIYFLPYYLYWH